MPSRAKRINGRSITIAPEVVIIVVFLREGFNKIPPPPRHCEDDDHDDDGDPQGRLADHLSPLQTGSPPPDEDGCVSVYFELFLQFIVRDGRENLLTRVFPAVFSWAASTYNQPFLQMVSS